MDTRRAVLVFDYDGVIADTERLHWKSWAIVLHRYGLELTWDEYCSRLRGIDDGRVCESIMQRVPGANRETLDREVFERKQMVLDWSLLDTPIPPATIELLTTLKGYRIGLVTSSERFEVEPVLRSCGIRDAFHAVVFGGEAAPKPAPDPYLLIARKLISNPGIAFEDSEPGIQSARAAGFHVVRINKPDDLAKSVAASLDLLDNQ